MGTSVAEPVLAPPRMQLGLITVNDLPRLWPQVEPLLKRACDYSAGEMMPAMVIDGMGARDGVVRLHMLALGGERVSSIMIVAVNVYPQGPKLDCLLTSGEGVDDWLPFEPQMDEWARSLGCVAVRIPRARKGWARVLNHWRKISGACYVLERDI